nr:uncharacterized protein si:dkey-83m22.7 isoform X2 [Pseudochaenichthys georgianus]
MTVRHTIKHLAYQPLRTRNKHLQQKWDKASYELHRGKLKEERTMKRENNMLEETISHILKTTGRVDNRNYYEQKSIGKEKRQLELLRITKENQMILLHLSQCKSHYNVRSWHDNWLKTLKVMDRIARYPQGRTNQKGQEKRTDCNKEQKISADESTNSPSSKKAKGKAESKEKRKETIERRLTLSQIHQMNPPDTAENPGSSDTIQIKTDTFPHTAKILSADGSEMPNIPATSSPAEE